MEDITFMVDMEYNAQVLVGNHEPPLKLPKEIHWQVAFNLSADVPARVVFIVPKSVAERADISAWLVRLAAMKLPNAVIYTQMDEPVG